MRFSELKLQAVALGVVACVALAPLALVGCDEGQDQTTTNEQPAASLLEQPGDTEQVYSTPSTDPSADAEQQKTQQAAQFPIKTVFECGGTVVEFTAVDETRGDMTIANVSYAMEIVPLDAAPASGAKYQNLGNPKTSFWNKGADATVTVDGTELPACVVSEATEPTKPVRAVGQEPGWMVVVEKGMATLTMQSAGGEPTALKIDHDKTEGVRRMISAQQGEFILQISETPCVDSMSGEPFAATATLVYQGETMNGCAHSRLRHIDWALSDLNGAGVVGDTVTMTLSDNGRVFGNAGCNQYNGSYSLEGETMAFSPNMASTMMACVDEAMMKQEQSFLKTLPTLTRAVVDEAGTLTLSNEAGVTVRFEE